MKNETGYFLNNKDVEITKQKPGPEKSLFYAIKLAVGIGLFALLLFKNINTDNLINILSSVKWEYIYIIIALHVILDLVSSIKWGIFIKERGYNISLMRLFNIYLIGRFFNNFVPSSTGGDIARAYFLGKQINSYSKSAASILMERFTGLIAIIFMAIIFSLINIQILKEPVIGISIGILIIVCILFLLFFNPELVKKIAVKFHFLPLSKKIFPIMKKLLEDVSYFRRKYKLLQNAMLLSFLFHLLSSFNVYLCCLAIGLNPTFLDIIVINSIIRVVVIIPVSPNNIGWWEWAFSVFLVYAGATIAQGFTVALIIRAKTFIFSLLGGILFLLEKNKSKLYPEEPVPNVEIISSNPKKRKTCNSTY